MRCKVGDLAVILRSIGCPENIGRLVTVVGPSPHEDCDWVCEAGRPLAGKSAAGFKGAAHRVSFADYQLRPIRDNDGVDEILTWKQREIA